MKAIESFQHYGKKWLFPKATFILGMLDDDKKYIPYIPDSKSKGSEASEPDSKPSYSDRPRTKMDFESTSHKSITETIVLIALIVGALMTPVALWIAIPYPTPQIEDFFRDHHTGAIKLTIDQQADCELYSILEDVLRQTTGQGLEAISSEEEFTETSEDNNDTAPLRANFIISSDKVEDEIIFRAISQEGGTKLTQLSWDLATLKMDQASVKELGSAKLMSLKSGVKGKDNPQMLETWFQGNYIVGNMGESLEQTIDTIDSDAICSNSGNTYLIQNWPYGSESPLIAVIENKNNCLARLAETLLNKLDYTFSDEKEFKEITAAINSKKTLVKDTKVTAPGSRSPQSRVRDLKKKHIREYIHSISSSLDAVEGISFEAFYNKNDNIELPLICKLRSNSNLEGIQEDINNLISKISSSTGDSLKLWEEMISERDYAANIELKISEDEPMPHNFSKQENTAHSGGLSVSPQRSTNYSSSSAYNKPIAYRKTAKKKRYVPTRAKKSTSSNSDKYTRTTYSSKPVAKSKSNSIGRVSGTKATRRRYSTKSSTTKRKTYRKTYRSYRRRSG